MSRHAIDRKPPQRARAGVPKGTLSLDPTVTDMQYHCISDATSHYEQPLVAPQLGQAWQEPARCMMSPQTWQSTVSDSRTTGRSGIEGGASAAEGARSSSGSSA